MLTGHRGLSMAQRHWMPLRPDSVHYDRLLFDAADISFWARPPGAAFPQWNSNNDASRRARER